MTDREIDENELRDHPGRILADLEKGHTFTVLRGAEPVAELTPSRSRPRFVPRSVFAASSRRAAYVSPETFRAAQDEAADHTSGDRR